jgi:phosphoribosylaminoimidazole-succinocarboxamide synthase
MQVILREKDGAMSVTTILGGEAVLKVSLPGVKHLRTGKVREVFDLGDSLLFACTDRISAFDCVMPNGIPLKGKVLSQLSAWWFEKVAHLTAHHVIETNVDKFPSVLKPYRDLLRGRSMIVRKSEVLPVECIARGYLIGSGWKEYQAGGSVCGIKLRPGYQQADKLDAPIFTPSTKAETGHDMNISFEEAAKIVGTEIAAQIRDLTLKVYGFAAEFARTRGIILADTKFEFGIREGKIILIDEILTPDSSRFWPSDSYKPGMSPPSFDKQFVRDYLEEIHFDKRPPGPELPERVVRGTMDRYLEAYRLLTGHVLPIQAP